MSEANQPKAAYKEAKRAANATRKEAIQAAEAAYNEAIKPFTTKYEEVRKMGASHQALQQLLTINECAHRVYERDVKYAWAVYKKAIEAAKAGYKEAKQATIKRKPPR